MSQTVQAKARLMRQVELGKKFDLEKWASVFLNAAFLFSLINTFVHFVHPPKEVHYFIFTCYESAWVYLGLLVSSNRAWVTRLPLLAYPVVWVGMLVSLKEIYQNSLIGDYNMAVGQLGLFCVQVVILLERVLSTRAELQLKIAGLFVSLFAFVLWFNTRRHEWVLFQFSEFSFYEVFAYLLICFVALGHSRALLGVLGNGHQLPVQVGKLIFLIVTAPIVILSATVQVYMDVSSPLLLPMGLALGTSVLVTGTLFLLYHALDLLRRDDSDKLNRLNQHRSRVAYYVGRIRTRNREYRAYSQLLRQDLSEQSSTLKQAIEQSREARRKALTALESKMKLVSMLTNDLRGPVSVLQALSEEGSRSGSANPYGQSALQSITRYLQTLLQDLDGISKWTEDVPRGATNSPLQLADWVGELLAYADALADSNHLRFVSRVDLDSLDVTLSMDPVRTKQLVFNVIGHFVKQNQPGELSLHVTLHQQQSLAPRLLITLAHSGVTLERTSTGSLQNWALWKQDPVQAGSEIGLFVARDLADRLGGRLSFETLEHQGVLCEMSLPVSAVKLTSHSAADGQTSLPFQEGLSV